MEKTFARIKNNANMLYSTKQFSKFNGGEFPTSIKNFEVVLKRLAGQIFPVSHIDGNIICLKYPKSLIRKNNKGNKVLGIDLDTDFVDIFKVSRGGKNI